MKKPIPYGRQSITQEDIDAVIDALQSDWLTQGPRVREFEKKFAEYVGAKYAVAVSNGTAALHLSNLALGVKEGQKILTTPITFAATANSVLYCGAEVEFVDIDPETYLIDLDLLEDKLRNADPGTYAGIIPVDFTGLPVNTEKLRRIAEDYSLWIIEDACHAPGGYYIDSEGNKTMCGNGIYADLTCFSFHPVKHIATAEGGMITTNDPVLFQDLLKLRTHGITKENMVENHGGWYHEMHDLGYNYRLPDLNCALGIAQLKKAEDGLARRREIADKYTEAFSGKEGIKVQKQPKDFFNAWHLYVIEVANRKALYDHLQEKNIYAQIHYIPTHLHPFYRKKGWGLGDLPKAELYYESCISLPMFPTLTGEEQEYVINCILNFCSKC